LCNWAIKVELPPKEFKLYRQQDPRDDIELPTGCQSLPFKDCTLDFVYSSHLIEDFLDWTPILEEWKRVVKPGGHMVLLLPDKERWIEALKRGQPPNCAHKHEGRPGELSGYFPGWEIIRDSLTEQWPNDYSILFIARKNK
jgi:SAM-dependent methyltransferase